MRGMEVPPFQKGRESPVVIPGNNAAQKGTMNATRTLVVFAFLAAVFWLVSAVFWFFSARIEIHQNNPPR